MVLEGKATRFIAVFGVSNLVISLAPILFSVGWICATYLLFHELGGKRAGLVACTAAAFSNWYVIHFNVYNNGGYAPVYCFGTAALWICARLTSWMS